MLSDTLMKTKWMAPTGPGIIQDLEQLNDVYYDLIHDSGELYDKLEALSGKEEDLKELLEFVKQVKEDKNFIVKAMEQLDYLIINLEWLQEFHDFIKPLEKEVKNINID